VFRVKGLRVKGLEFWVFGFESRVEPQVKGLGFRL
jgi:hypothetical protein